MGLYRISTVAALALPLLIGSAAYAVEPAPDDGTSTQPSVTIAVPSTSLKAATSEPSPAAAAPKPAAAAMAPAHALPAKPTKAATVEPAKPAAPSKPAATLVANVDLAAQQLTVLVDGAQVHQWRISSGVREHPTPVGNFRAEWTAKMWYSKKYDDAPMPHAVFFKNGAAIHATRSTSALGRPASHGCVRLAPTNAETFYKLVANQGVAHTRINVFGVPKYTPVVVAAARERGPTMPRPVRSSMIYQGVGKGAPRAGQPAGQPAVQIVQSNALVWPGDRPSGHAAPRGW